MFSKAYALRLSEILMKKVDGSMGVAKYIGDSLMLPGILPKRIDAYYQLTWTHVVRFHRALIL